MLKHLNDAYIIRMAMWLFLFQRFHCEALGNTERASGVERTSQDCLPYIHIHIDGFSLCVISVLKIPLRVAHVEVFFQGRGWFCQHLSLPIAGSRPRHVPKGQCAGEDNRMSPQISLLQSSLSLSPHTHTQTHTQTHTSHRSHGTFAKAFLWKNPWTNQGGFGWRGSFLDRIAGLASQWNVIKCHTDLLLVVFNILNMIAFPHRRSELVNNV